MSIDTLEDLYIEQMKDIYSANKQAIDVTDALAKAATDQGLSDALSAGSRGIQDGIDALAEIAKRHGESPSGEHCRGMEGLVKEARAHALDATFGDDAVKDAMIITQYQRMVHYAIAGYGCLTAFARRLDLGDDVATLQNCLDASYEGDRTMSELATGGINADAAS